MLQQQQQVEEEQAYEPMDKDVEPQDMGHAV